MPNVIANARRTMPHTLHRVRIDDKAPAGLSALDGCDDLAVRSTRLTNHPRDALLHIHPALERLLGKHTDRPDVTTLLAQTSTSAALAQLSQEAMGKIAEKGGSLPPAKTLPDQITATQTA